MTEETEVLGEKHVPVALWHPKSQTEELGVETGPPPWQAGKNSIGLYVWIRYESSRKIIHFWFSRSHFPNNDPTGNWRHCTKYRYYAITVKFATLKKIKSLRVRFSGMWRRVCGWIYITISEKYLVFTVEIRIWRRMYPAPSKRFYLFVEMHSFTTHQINRLNFYRV
jgi:hypothetical protein